MAEAAIGDSVTSIWRGHAGWWSWEGTAEGVAGRGGDLLVLWEGRLQCTRHLLLHLLTLFSLRLPVVENGHQLHLCCASDVAWKLSDSLIYMSRKGGGTHFLGTRNVLHQSLFEVSTLCGVSSRRGSVDCDSDAESAWMLKAAVGGTAAADPVAVHVGAVLPATLPILPWMLTMFLCSTVLHKGEVLPDPSISSRQVL